MEPIGIVPALDKLEDRETSLRPTGERLPLDEFTFERRKERFAHRVVVAVSPQLDPIDGRTPASLQRFPKARAVYWQP